MRKNNHLLVWITMILAFGILGGCFLGCGQSKRDQAQKHFQAGINYSSERQFDKALSEMKKAVELDPTYADARFYLGGLYHATRAYDWALQEYQQVLRLDPNYPRMHTALANLYYERGMRSWGRAVKIDHLSFWIPDTTQKLPYQDKAGLLKLIEEYNGRVLSDTADAEAFSKLSQAYYELATEEYQKAVQENPSDTTAQLYLGLTYSELGYPQKAKAQHEILKGIYQNAADLLQNMLEMKEKEKEKMGEFKKGQK